MLVAISVAASAGRTADAAPAATEDGIYGRFTGDLETSLLAAASLRPYAGLGAGAAARAWYLSTAGLYASFDATAGHALAGRRTLSFGTSLRPLFLPRWAYDLERGPAWADLTLDSLALELGTLWTWSDAQASTFPGFEVALSLETPLSGAVDGLWLGIRTALQWTSPELAGTVTPHGSPSALLQLGLSWHSLLSIHIVDAGDSVLR